MYGVGGFFRKTMEHIKFKDKVDFINKIVSQYGLRERKFFEVYELKRNGRMLRLTITDGCLFYCADIIIRAIGSNGTRNFSSLKELEVVIKRIINFFNKTIE